MFAVEGGRFFNLKGFDIRWFLHSSRRVIVTLVN